jgi:DNA-binding beta-propeller fold protein YncE
MTFLRPCPAVFCLLGALGATPLAAQGPAEPGSTYHVTRRIRVGGDGFWDYLSYDRARHRLFLSHGSQVDVVAPDSGIVVGHILHTPGVHGIALAQDLGRGFVSNGRDGSVTIFDLGTLATVGRVAVTGRNPDAILYDSITHRVFTFNGGSANATAIDAAGDSVIGTLALGGKPEFAVSDGRSEIFVNIEDRSELVGIDARALAVRTRWPLPDCEEPTALAIDREHGRLFSGCANGRVLILDVQSGRVVATAPIGAGVDGAAYDPVLGLAFASTGDGALSVIREDGPGRVHVVANVPTQAGGRTMALDTITHRVFIATASLAPAPAATREQPRPRPAVLPGSFVVLVLEP